MMSQMNWKIVALLVGVVFVSTGLMLPAVMTLVTPEYAKLLFPLESEFDPQFAVGFFLVMTITSGLLAVLVGHALEQRVGLGTPLVQAWLDGDRSGVRVMARRLPSMLALGFGLAVVVLGTGFACRGLLPRLPPGFSPPPIWQGMLMMTGAAAREEILFRFGAVNLLIWLLQTVFGEKVPSRALVWMAIVTTSIGFGVLHVVVLPTTIGLTVQAKILGAAIATTVGGVLGWVYWRHGLVAAIACHFAVAMTVFLGVQIAMALGSYYRGQFIVNHYWWFLPDIS